MRVTGFYAAYGVLGALYERCAHRRAAARSRSRCSRRWRTSTSTPSRTTSPAGEVMGPYSRPERVAVATCWSARTASGSRCTCRRREKFWQGLASAIERPDTVRGPALRHARGAHRAPGRPDRAARPASSRSAHARRVVQPAAGAGRAARADVRHRRGAARTRRRSTCSCWSSAPSTRPWATFRTVRSPVTFDGERSLSVRPPPTLGEHNGELANGWLPRGSAA